MLDLTFQSALSTAMLMVGDLLVLAAVLVPAVVLIGILATSISRVSFTQVIGYWLFSLLLCLTTGAGLVAKANVPSSTAAAPNGILFGFTDTFTLTLLGIALLLLIISGGLILYVLNK